MNFVKTPSAYKRKRIALSWFIPAVFLFPLITVQTSCKKLVEAPPNSVSIESKNVFSTDATAAAVLIGIYNALNAELNSIQGNRGIALITGLSADELTLYKNVPDAYQYFGPYNNTLSIIAPSAPGVDFWSPFYSIIYKCNAAIEGLNAAKSLTPVVKQHLLGEAEFVRAYIYFWLVNMYGDVPLALTTDPEVNSLLPRSPKAQVYQQIIADLQDAKEKLSANYLDVTLLNNTTERVRPTKWAASALLARVYLYQASLGDNEAWAKAETEASAVINNTSLYSLPPLNNVFLKNSQEAIWQLQPTKQDFNTREGNIFIIPASGPSFGFGAEINPVYLTKFLLNSFEPGDQRVSFGNWVDTTVYNINSTTYDTVAYSYKYKIRTSTGVKSADGMSEYFMMLRLGEQYLVRTEARVRLGKTGEAQSDLNAIRNRAGLPNTTSGDEASLLNAILEERRHELFCEGGHRWFDLKRTGKVDEVMTIITPIKSNGTTQWQSFQQLYPIQYNELQRGLNLVQNPGYH